MFRIIIAYLLISCVHVQPMKLSCPPSKDSIEQLMLDVRIPGMAIAVVNRTHILYKQGFGYTTPKDVSTEQPIDPDESIFTLASISKTLIAVSAMQLVENNLLDLDENINRYLPNGSSIHHPMYPDTAITMRHLLSHTSSIGPNLEKEMSLFLPGDDFSKSNMTEAVFDFISSQSNWLPHPPGTNFSYSNTATTLAAVIIEMIVGFPYETYVHYRIIQSLGLNRYHASYRLSDFKYKESQLVQHYIFNISMLDDAKQFLPQLNMYKASNGANWFYIEPYSVKLYPAGLLRTSANSLAIYLRSFLNNFPELLLESSSTDHMIQVITETESNTKFGLSWYWENVGNRSLIGHRGSMPAVVTSMFANEKRTTGVVLLSNADANDSGLMAGKTRNTINELLTHFFDCFE